MPLPLPGPTERLTWQWWGSGGAARAQNLWGDDKVTALIGGPFSAAAVASRLAVEIAGGEADQCQYWPIFMAGHARRGAKHVGVAGLRRYTGAVEGHATVYEIGFHLLPAYAGRGLATEAGVALLGFAFLQLRADAVFAGHHPANDASRKVLTKLGFSYTHDEYYEPTGLLHPSYLCTAAEWQRQQEKSAPGAAGQLPPVQTSPAAWYGPEMAADPSRWTWQLSESEASEIEVAACKFLERGEGRLPAMLEAADFPLSPTLVERLSTLRRELIEGRGFELLRGLPLHSWPRDRAATAFLGIGAHSECNGQYCVMRNA
jgi:RimJ/RimL family protein N-acetyltransferase